MLHHVQSGLPPSTLIGQSSPFRNLTTGYLRQPIDWPTLSLRDDLIAEEEKGKKELNITMVRLLAGPPCLRGVQSLTKPRLRRVLWRFASCVH